MLQHWGAAELIQGVGGIEFLTQLREDIETSLRPIIDQILENIMRLPEAKGQEHAPECIYHKTTDSGLYIYIFFSTLIPVRKDWSKKVVRHKLWLKLKILF